MKFTLGYVVVLGCVLGGYMMHGGSLSALWQPSEFVIIGGAAAGAFIVANPIHNMRLEGRLCRLRHGYDGLLFDALVDRKFERAPKGGTESIFLKPECHG